MSTEPSQKLLKADLRKTYRSQRAALEAVQRSRLDQAINRHLVTFAEQTKPALIAAYMAFDGEPNLGPALEKLERAGAKLALPVIVEEPAKSIIEFRQYSVQEELQVNRYGIPEPVESPQVWTSEIDVILLPLVAWDATGGRLGMGASFYDRHLQPFLGLRKPLRMGVAYDLQKAEKLPMDPWDVRLHAILTESGWFTCAG